MGRKASRIKVTYADGSTKSVRPGHFKKKKDPREARRRRKRYYLSKGWRERRFLRLEHDGFRCADCRRGEWQLQSRLEVHHLTYERFGREQTEDLITLCQKCHKARHAWARRKGRPIA